MSLVRLLLVLSAVLLFHAGGAAGVRAQAASDSTVSTVSGGYDPAVGLFIEDAASGFRANLGAYAQFRYSMNWRDGAQDSTESFERGYSMPRAELFLFGNYKERFGYHFRALIEEATDFSLFVAYLQYQFSDKWNVTVGKQFIPLSREDWYYAQDLLAMDFSANDNTFAVGTSLGVVFQNVASDRFRMWVGVSNGAFSAKRSFPPVAASDVLVNSRFEFQLAGTDWSVWDDMIGRRGRPFGVLVGVGPGYLVRERRNVAVRRQGQVNLDVSLHRQPVVFCLDRAGITGDDGPSHHGVLDMVLMSKVPGMTIFCPSSYEEVAVMLHDALDLTDGPSMLRWPKTAAPSVPPDQVGDGLHGRKVRTGADVCLIGVGKMLAAASEAAELLADEGVEATVWDPRIALPVPDEVIDDAAGHPAVLTIEDGYRDGGIGSMIADTLRERCLGQCPPVRVLGVPRQYIPHGKADGILARIGLDGAGVAASTRELLDTI